MKKRFFLYVIIGFMVSIFATPLLFAEGEPEPIPSGSSIPIQTVPFPSGDPFPNPSPSSTSSPSPSPTPSATGLPMALEDGAPLSRSVVPRVSLTRANSISSSVPRITNLFGNNNYAEVTNERAERPLIFTRLPISTEIVPDRNTPNQRRFFTRNGRLSIETSLEEGSAAEGIIRRHLQSGLDVYWRTAQEIRYFRAEERQRNAERNTDSTDLVRNENLIERPLEKKTAEGKRMKFADGQVVTVARGEITADSSRNGSESNRRFGSQGVRASQNSDAGSSSNTSQET